MLFIITYGKLITLKGIHHSPRDILVSSIIITKFSGFPFKVPSLLLLMRNYQRYKGIQHCPRYILVSSRIITKYSGFPFKVRSSLFRMRNWQNYKGFIVTQGISLYFLAFFQSILGFYLKRAFHISYAKLIKL